MPRDVRGFKAGDPPPSDYVAWQDWAETQDRAGLRQKTCGVCGKWRFPQELSSEVIRSEDEATNGDIVQVESPVCLACIQLSSSTTELET